MVQSYPEWRRLEEILAQIAQHGIERLSADDIFEFGTWYRRAAAELSYQRTHAVSPETQRYLNDLLGRCYPYVYSAPRRPWPSVRRFFAADFPRAIRRHLLWIVLATLISVVPGLLGFAVTWRDRTVADQVLPAGLLESSDRVAERHATPADWLPLLERTPAATTILTHNIGIAIAAFAGGMTAGVVTLFLLVYNGLMLGVVAAVVGGYGHATSLNFWAFVAPHGVLELTAIFISGGAGLLMAFALVNPGELPRRLALGKAGKEAVQLMLGVAAMLTVAGFIEGFFSPMNIAEPIKLSVAAVEAVLLVGYFAFAGRGTVGEEPELGTLMTPLPPM